jgi:hypothetical protein
MRISQKISNRLLRNLSTFDCIWCARQMAENGLPPESSGPYRPGALPIGWTANYFVLATTAVNGGSIIGVVLLG